MEYDGVKPKKKIRRKSSSKCLKTATYAIEKSPFKDTEKSGISINDCLNLKTTHILSKVTANLKAGLVIQNIFKQDVGVRMHGLLSEQLKSDSDFKPMQEVMGILIRQNKRLNLYFSLALKQIDLVFHTEDCSAVFPKKVVFHVLYFIVSHVLPASLLGSRHNLNIFINCVKNIVYGCYHQRFSLSSLVHGFKVSHILWLQKTLPSNSLRLHVLACTVKWLLQYVQTIIPRLWHIVVHTSKEIMYFNKKKWQSIKKNEIETLISNGKIKRVDVGTESANKICDTGHTRFLVKKHGLRPITVFRAPSSYPEKVERENARMLVMQFSHLIGSTSTLFSPPIDQVLQEGILKIVKCYPDPSTRPAYYFVRGDVKDAFGSVDHRKLLTILESMLTRVTSEGKMVEWSVRFGRRTLTIFESPGLPLPPTVVKGGKERAPKMFPILLHIRNHVHRLATTFDGSQYHIIGGIPQGMHLSAVLCDLYYSSLDAEHLKDFTQTKEDEIFIRFCDDYLFLSPSAERAQLFLKKLHKGFPDYNVSFNHQKTLSNVHKPLQILPFCGYILDLASFNVQANFSSYEKTKVAWSLNLRTTRQPGKVLFNRMRIILKLNPILLDRRLNSKHCAMKNIYKAALLMAFRFCAYVNSCFPAGKLNQTFALNCVKKGCNLIRKRVIRTISRISPGEWISVDEIKFIVFKAFVARMRKGGAHQYPRTFNYLKKTIASIATKLPGHKLKLLQTTSHDALPEPFNTMKW